MSDVPILVLVFNRPRETQKVFNQLKKLKPKQLFVAADGPRIDREGESEKTSAVRAIFEEQVDWDCELKTLFRVKNLGCRNAVSSAIDWFFEQVEYGVILEDDCVPDLSFFPFCAELLERYKEDEKIYQISGFNYYGEFPEEESYFSSRMAFIWGWATWRRAWKNMDVDMQAFPAFQENAANKMLVNDSYAQRYMLEKWEATFQKKNDSWAYAWVFSVFVNDGLCIMPKYNLIQNAGLNADASNTREAMHYQKTAARAIPFPLNHPENISSISDKREQQLFYAAHKSKWRLRLRHLLPKSWLLALSKFLRK